MPIYEFYCRSCHTIYSFLSKTIQPDKRPRCPGCGKATLEKQMSLFAATGRAQGDGEAGGELPFDESRMESAMDALARDAESVSEEDPRQAAGLMRKFSRMTGMDLGPGMKEALGRLEAGESPDVIEAELGDRLEQEEPFVMPEKKGRARSGDRPPRRDATLHEM
jgi:putative FmdB family regulatory protein